MSEFLKDLPSYDKRNFMYFNYGNSVKNYSKRPSIYLSTIDIPSKQIIVNDKTPSSLSYLHEKWNKEISSKSPPNKRTLDEKEKYNEDVQAKKKLRLTATPH